VLYTGNGSSAGTENAITGLGFQPDFVWLKSRSHDIYHAHYNVLTGVDAQLHIGTEAEYDRDSFVSFDSDGFTVKRADAGHTQTNLDGGKFAAWCWKAATAASGPTTGSGTGKAYSARYNTDAGFSLIAYEGNDTAAHTIPHHLSIAPELIVVKRREATDPWCVYHEKLHASTPEQYADEWNATASFHDTTYWNDTAPTSSVFALGSINNVNGVDEGYIAYCWHSVDGYSKVGGYEGNGNDDGTFVYTGFRPAYLWIKNIDASSNWSLYDSERHMISDVIQTTKPYNPNKTTVIINATSVEDDHETFTIDLLSNGFKCRTDGTITNASNTYIYFAIAETPFKYSNAK
jgi:hypothetical protein